MSGQLGIPRIPQQSLLRRTLVTQSVLESRVSGGAANVAPTAEFSSVVTFLQVNFTDLSSDSDGSIASWDWDFGDGTAHSTLQNPSHTYTTVGNKTVTLIVTDNLGTPSAPVSHTVTPTVHKDATSNIYCPISAAEFTALGLTAPQSIWLCQEASGNLADSVGSTTLTAANTPSYNQAVTGWTRLGVTIADGTGQRFVAGTGVGPSPATTSQLWIGWIKPTAAPSATHKLWGCHGATACDLQLTTTPRLRAVDGANTATGTVDPTGSVIPLALLFDRTNSLCLGTSLTEKLAPTFASTPTDGNKGLGGNAAGDSQGATMVYGFMYSGGAAEINATQLKTILTTLGWSITWS